MCLAISPGNQFKRGRLAALWHRVAKTPLRLFMFAAVVHALVITSIYMVAGLNGYVSISNYLLPALAFGLLALPVFGYVLTRMPEKYSMSPIHYGRYSSIYMCFMFALILLELGMLFGPVWAVIGLWLLVPGWLLALGALRNLQIWMPAKDRVAGALLMVLMAFTAAMLIYHALAFSINLVVYNLLPLLVLALVWPAALILTVLLSSHAPRKGSEISL